MTHQSVFDFQTTGIAATNIGGCTLHGWAGIGLGKGDPDKLFWQVFYQMAARDRWKECKVLIIDESEHVKGSRFVLRLSNLSLCG